MNGWPVKRRLPRAGFAGVLICRDEDRAFQGSLNSLDTGAGQAVERSILPHLVS